MYLVCVGGGGSSKPQITIMRVQLTPWLILLISQEFRATPVVYAHAHTADYYKGLMWPRRPTSGWGLSLQEVGWGDKSVTKLPAPGLGLARGVPNLGRRQPAKGGREGHRVACARLLASHPNRCEEYSPGTWHMGKVTRRQPCRGYVPSLPWGCVGHFQPRVMPGAWRNATRSTSPYTGPRP
jgi:hypothetical protein